MQKKILKMVAHVVLGVVFLLAIMLGGVLLWVVTGPRPVPQLQPYIIQALAPEGAGYRLTMGKATLTWDGWKQPLALRVDAVRAQTLSGREFAHFPQATLGVSIVHLLVGQVVPKSLQIDSPVMSLLQTQDGRVHFGTPLPEEGAAEVEEENTVDALEIAQLFANLHYLEVRDADVSIGRYSGMLLRVPDADFHVYRRGEVLSGVMEFALKGYDERIEAEATPRFSLTASMNRENYQMTGEVAFSNVSPLLFDRLIPEEWQRYSRAFNSAIDGNAQVSANLEA